VTTTTIRSRFSEWLAGLTVGGCAGLLFGVWPTLGAVIVIAFLAGVVRTKRRSPPTGGLLIGLPIAWLVLVGNANLACERFNAVPGQGCIAPDLTGWIIVAVAILVAGVMLTGAAARRTS
jgi:hypothetical protein